MNVLNGFIKIAFLYTLITILRVFFLGGGGYFRKSGYFIYLPHFYITALIHQFDSIKFSLNSLLNILYFVY